MSAGISKRLSEAKRERKAIGEGENRKALVTGEAYSVRDFILAAGGHLGFDQTFERSGVDEVGIDRKSGQTIVRVDPTFYRPTEVDQLCGDPGKAQRVIGSQRQTRSGNSSR